MLESQKIVFHYDGEALKDHKMQIEAVIDSLQGTCELLKETHLLVNGTIDDLKITVQPFDEGSFEFIIDVIQNPQEHLDILAITGLSATAIPAALLTTMKQIAGRKIQRLTLNKDGDCLVHIEDEEQPIVAPSFYRELLSSKTISKAMSKIAYTPLKKEGIDSLTVSAFDSTDNEAMSTVLEVSKEESKSYRASRNPVIEKRERVTIHEDVPITFLTVHSDKNRDWRITNHEHESVSVTICDEDFVKNVRNGTESNVFVNSYNVDLKETLDLATDRKTYTITSVYPQD
ncbi:hypothetical protein [Vibrio navarrensis]|uniref:hypothetical protein n=1 Tax=Vibrio navarrensis TaxID=29495 RepID=UPI00057D532E|nr:hypothetical protein [Vibrio navarrensis]